MHRKLIRKAPRTCEKSQRNKERHPLSLPDYKCTKRTFPWSLQAAQGDIPVSLHSYSTCYFHQTVITSWAAKHVDTSHVCKIVQCATLRGILQNWNPTWFGQFLKVIQPLNRRINCKQETEQYLAYCVHFVWVLTCCTNISVYASYQFSLVL